MRRNRREIAEQFPIMREMYDAGHSVVEIAKMFNISRSSVYDTFALMGDTATRRFVEENLTYAKYTQPVLERIAIGNKLYTDITPLFLPR